VVLTIVIDLLLKSTINDNNIFNRAKNSTVTQTSKVNTHFAYYTLTSCILMIIDLVLSITITDIDNNTVYYLSL